MKKLYESEAVMLPIMVKSKWYEFTNRVVTIVEWLSAI